MVSANGALHQQQSKEKDIKEGKSFMASSVHDVKVCGYSCREMTCRRQEEYCQSEEELFYQHLIGVSISSMNKRLESFWRKVIQMKTVLVMVM